MAPVYCVVLSELEWRNHCRRCQRGGQKAEREGQATSGLFFTGDAPKH